MEDDSSELVAENLKLHEVVYQLTERCQELQRNLAKSNEKFVEKHEVKVMVQQYQNNFIFRGYSACKQYLNRKIDHIKQIWRRS